MYGFTDTTDQAGALSLPAESLTFNGVTIENVIAGYRTLTVSGRELQDKDIDSITVGRADGSYYKNTRYDSRIITVAYMLQASTASELMSRFNALSTILDTREGSLVFADEPDKFYIGTATSVSLPDEGTLSTMGEIAFTCSDPFKYAVDTKSFADVDGILSPVSESNYKSDTVLSASFESDCGYVAFVNQDGKVLQFGNPYEDEGVDYTRSESLVKAYQNLTAAKLSAFTQGAGTIFPLTTSTYTQNGSMRFATVDGVGVFTRNIVESSASNATWYGASISKVLEDSEGVSEATEFTIGVRIYFRTLHYDSTGMSQLNITNSAGESVITLTIYKNSPGKNAKLFLHVKGVKKEELSIGVLEGASSFGFPWTNGIVQLEKWGSNLTMRFRGVSYSYNVSSAISAHKITWYWGDLYKSIQLNHTYNYLRHLRFTKHNVEKWKDVPNKFSEESILTVNTQTKEIYLDGIYSPELDTLGNDWDEFKITPGENTINCMYSSWVETAPNFSAEIRERYL